MSIFSEAARLEQQNRPFALAQIVKSQGSTLRRSTEMIVLPDGNIFGTIGGGTAERLVIEQAIEAIRQRKSQLFGVRMTCPGADAVEPDGSGLVEVFISVHDKRPRRVPVAAGHVKLMAKPGELVVIRGAGDVATGVAIRLARCGYRIVMLEIEQPTAIRRSAAFAQAVFDGSTNVEGLTARLVATAQEAIDVAECSEIALLVDPQAASLGTLQPGYLIDAILAKKNLGTHKNMAPITIGLGPGFAAGDDCDAVIETNRGHRLGRVILSGAAEPNTGIPGEIAGKSDLRVVRAPCDGVFRSRVALGDLVAQGTQLAQVGDTAVIAPMAGMVRGLLHDGLQVTERFKIGDIDPRGEKADFLSASDKALAIGGGVLEAMLRLRKKAPA